MKLATLLAQYLYSNHRLDLPGIGTFLLDPSSINSPDISKQRSINLEGITFENNSSVKESPDLIAFISAQSGKMKALAQADLGSHLQLAQQFLNMSKPFTFEGIGTLTILRSGQYKFAPLSVDGDKLKEYKTKDSAPVSIEESSAQYEPFFDKTQTKAGWRKPMIVLLIIAGIGLAIWGGYYISQKMSGDKPTVENTEVVPSPSVKEEEKPQPIQTDTITSPPKDTTQVMPVQINTTPQDSYKYILEVANSRRAFERYYRLKHYQWQVQMETKDSIQYKLFLLLPAMNADTTRILDSLTVMNGRQVILNIPTDDNAACSILDTTVYN
ncbi:MAG: hypothetical protein WDN26_12380 [Chitinophagaceae bacterium]